MLVKRSVNEASGKLGDNTKARQPEEDIENRRTTYRNQRRGRNVNSMQDLDEVAENIHKGKDMEETAPGSGNDDKSIQSSKGDESLHLANKFAALQENDNVIDNEGGKEGKDDQNTSIAEGKKDNNEGGSMISKEENEIPLRRIRKWVEEENKKKLKRDKAKKNWNDMVEEEEEDPVSHFNENTIFYERHGEIAALNVKTGNIKFSPIPKEKDGI